MLTKVGVRWCVAVTVALVLALIGAGSAIAAPSPTTPTTAPPPATITTVPPPTTTAPPPTTPVKHHGPAAPVSYYLALGDSVPVWNGPDSYPNLLLAHYQRKLPNMTLENMAVSGETTTSMMLYGQYAAALGFLKAHQGHVALITIDIGGNDIVNCAFTPGDSSPISPCSMQALATIKQNLSAMLAGLHAAAPGVPIIGMNYYNPVYGEWLAPGAPRALALSTVATLVALNQELTSLYGGPANTADVQRIFHATDFTTIVSSPWGEVPIAVDRACEWLDIGCQVGSPGFFGDDPNNAGAVAIATVFEQRINRLCISRAAGVFTRCGHRGRAARPAGATS